MVTHNVLNIKEVCSNCQEENALQIYFEYGSVWQYKYHIGHILKWGENDYGKQTNDKIHIKGQLKNENCSHCGIVFFEDKYEIMIENNTILGALAVKN
jgi:hypothetical protein